MARQQSLFKWLALAALVEWLLVRTITRAAIHIPKTEAIIAGYTAVSQLGQAAAAFVALLALVLLLWISWQHRRERWLAAALVGLAVLSLLFLLAAPPAWLALCYQLLAVTAVLLICAGMVNRIGAGAEARPQIASLLLPSAALCAGLFYQLLPNLYALLRLPGPPPLAGVLFNLGELFIMGSVLAWFWSYGRSRSWRIWLLAGLPALFFALSFLRDPAMTGILAIWSTGLTLFLPWPAYALALWLAGMTALANWQARPAVAYAVLLLISAGYAPQLSSQLFCALIALWLLAQPLPSLQNQPYLLRKKSQAPTMLLANDK